MVAYPPRVALALFWKQLSACDVGVSTLCGAVSTRGITVFVPAMSELYMYGGISEPGMGTLSDITLEQIL